MYKKGYMGAKNFFQILCAVLQTIYCFRFDYAYLCRVYFSTLLLCICIISLGLKLLSSLFSSTYFNMHFIFKRIPLKKLFQFLSYLVEQIVLFWMKKIPRNKQVPKYFLKHFLQILVLTNLYWNRDFYEKVGRFHE